jgi:hypothetical protein
MSRLDRILTRLARTAPTASRPPAELLPIMERLDALEALVEALQDSVDRQARRYDERFNDLGRQIQPDQLARSLSDDARKRGI